MNEAVLDNSRISKHLGQVSEYKSVYDPRLLVNEPRASNRAHINVSDDDLPFVGFDTWNAYEVSGLTDDGLPVAGVAKIVYSCDSKYIVKSKSIKLYFNSFNMHHCGGDAQSVMKFITTQAERDLSRLLETEVRVHVEEACVANHEPTSSEFGSEYITLEKHLYLDNTTFDRYQEDPQLLQVGFVKHDFDVKYHSSLLKSNCRVTSQPDWGDVYIHMRGSASATPDELSLLRYIVSFRDECHFHEEICETLYSRLMNKYVPDELCVTCLYARRGGIDINPSRASHEHMLPEQLGDIRSLHHKTSKQ